MRLRRRVARIHIVQVRRESRLGLGVRNHGVEACHERLDGGGEGGAAVAGEAVVLEDPEGGAVRVGGGGGVWDIDLGASAAVEVDDGEPGLGWGRTG